MMGRNRSRFRTLHSAVLLLALAIPAAAQQAVDFTLNDLEGRPVRLSDFRGKNVVLVDFWATWCVPCVKELPHFQRLQDLYKDRGLVILVVTVDGPESVALVRPFLKRYQYTFPVLFDTDSKVVALYNPRVVLPYSFLVDRDGVIRYAHQGYSPGDEKILEEEIIKLLEAEGRGPVRGISFQGSEAFLNRNFSDDAYVADTRGGRASQVINQLDLTLASGRFVGGARLDAYLDFSPLLQDYTLAKRFLEYDAGALKLRAGDFYHTVGRGLAFSLLKTFEKDGLEYIIDTTVDGGKAVFSSGGFTAEAFGGWVDRDAPPHGDEPPVRDDVYGGTVGFRIGGVGRLAVNVVGASFQPGTLTGTKNVLMESVSLEVPSWKEKLRFYGEFLLARKSNHYLEDSVKGHGLYLEGGLFLGNFTALLEFKDYRNLGFEYNRPPLLETEQLPIMANQFVDASEDVTGAGVRVDLNIPRISTLVFGKLTVQGEGRGSVARDIVHAFSGFERRFRESGWLTLLAGYRRESSTSLAFWDTAGRTLHAQGNCSYPLAGRFSLEANFEIKDFRGDLAFGDRYYDYGERRSYFSLHYSPRWVVTLLYDHTTDPKILVYKDKRDWWGGQVEIKFGRNHAVRVFYGSIMGGIKCAGGICRFFPPFEGLRIDALLRF